MLRIGSLNIFNVSCTNSPKANFYFSDAFPVYSQICYEGVYRALNNKSQTFTVESVNADLRHITFLLSVENLDVFFRSFDTIFSVFSIFISAFNKFSLAKLNYSLLKSHFFIYSVSILIRYFPLLANFFLVLWIFLNTCHNY